MRMTKMKEDPDERVGSEIALYVMYACYISGIAFILGFVYWEYKVWADKTQFSWAIFFGLLVIALTFFIVGFMIGKRSEKDPE